MELLNSLADVALWIAAATAIPLACLEAGGWIRRR
jgi:hypothetical protein